LGLLCRSRYAKGKARKEWRKEKTMSISQADRYEDGGIILSNHAKKKLAKELARRSDGETVASISVQFTRDQIWQ
jgi:hypothetical protein